jgi:hypothetical protein
MANAICTLYEKDQKPMPVTVEFEPDQAGVRWGRLIVSGKMNSRVLVEPELQYGDGPRVPILQIGQKPPGACFHSVATAWKCSLEEMCQAERPPRD